MLLEFRTYADSPVRRKGFTVVEILVATTVLAVLVVILLSAISMSSNTLQRSKTTMQVFQSARTAFETMADTLEQATLNPSFDYLMDSTGTKPVRYFRKSDLGFVCGRAQDIIQPGYGPSHAVFFYAPLGEVGVAAHRGLNGLLNVLGFYLKNEKETTFLPAWHDQSNNRTECRLVMAWGLAEDIDTANAAPTWSVDAATGRRGILAEHISAMIIRPMKEDAAGNPTDLTTNYFYDSRAGAANDPQLPTSNQLPPLLEITMVVVDDVSARRASLAGISLLPNDDIFTETAKYAEDLAALEVYLRDVVGADYRVFRRLIAMRGARWSD